MREMTSPVAAGTDVSLRGARSALVLDLVRSQAWRLSSDADTLRDQLWALRLRSRVARLRAQRIKHETCAIKVRLERTRRDVSVILRRTRWLVNTGAPLPRIVATKRSVVRP